MACLLGGGRRLAYARGLAVAGDHEDGADGPVFGDEAGGASTVSLLVVLFTAPSGKERAWWSRPGWRRR